MWSGFQVKKLNTGRELELAANLAGPVPVRNPDPKKKIQNFFSKNQIHHYARSPHERTAWSINICPKKGGVKTDSNRETLCIKHPVLYVDLLPLLTYEVWHIQMYTLPFSCTHCKITILLPCNLNGCTVVSPCIQGGTCGRGKGFV